LLAGGQARLADDPRFNTVRGRIATGADVDVFMTADFQRKLNEASPEDLAERGLSPEQFEEMYYAFGGRDGVSAYASTVERQRITVEGYVLIGEGVPVLDWYRVDVDPVAFLSRLAASPWLALVGRVDAAAMWGSLRPILAAARPDTAPSLDDALAEFREETGTDVEKDIIGQIDGNVGLLVGRVAMMGPDAILFVQLRDVARAQETLDRATARIRRTLEEARSDPNASARARSTTLTEVSQGNTTFQQLGLGPIGAVCYGIVDDHLVVTASAERYRLILTGNSGLFDGVDNAAVATALRDPGSTVMYLDFEGLARDLSGFVPMIGPKVGPVMAALEALDDLVATSTVGEDGVRQTFELRASDADAWPMLMAFLLELGVGDDDAGMRHD
jgi:hypothetical protein